MTLADIAARVRAALSGFLDARDLKEIRRDRDGVYYQCPCGGTDHVAWRFPVRDLETGCTIVGLSDILNCFVTRQQWFIRMDVAAIIQDEEAGYLELLRKAESLVRKLRRRHPDRETFLVFLKDTHGIDRDIAEPFLD